MRAFFTFMLIVISLASSCQNTQKPDTRIESKKLILGIQSGAGWDYVDEAHLFNTAFSFSIDFHVKNDYFLQFAPQYSWLWKWNEHYLTLPIHLRKMFGEKISLFTGSSLTFDIGYFKDLGVSAGADYHFTRHSALAVSAFTFTLYDYDIDYLYVPVSFLYRYSF